jgi:tripartite-type tricarboxylate transporter receptor subunit TctC
MRLLQALVALFFLACASFAPAQYPNKRVTIVVPFPPGGSNDILARAVANELGQLWGQTVLVENRPGGGGSIGAGYVAKATPDGHTLMLVSSTFTINSVLQSKLPYDPVKSFSPVALVGKGPMMLVASPALQVKTPGELFALARSRPGKITYASAGSGSINQMATEMLGGAAGIKLTHVPYKGGSQAVNDLIGGHVDLYIGSMPQVMPHVRAGKVTALAVTSPQRARAAPEIAALAESLAGYELELWWGIFAPAGVPRDVILALNSAINRVLATPKMRQFLDSESAVSAPMSPDEFADFVGRELRHWRKVARDANIQAE